MKIRKRLGGSVAVSLLLVGCGSPLYTAGSFLQTGHPSSAAPAAVGQASVPLAPNEPPLQPASSEVIATGHAQLVDTQDMSEDEVAEDVMSASPTVQSLAKDVRTFHRVGMLRATVGGSLLLESTSGFWFWKKTTDYDLQAAPDFDYALRQHLNHKIYVEGRVDLGKSVTVEDFRPVVNLGAIFDGFTKGRIVGTVLDAKKWPIPGAKITAVRSQDHVLFQAAADANGAFRFRSLDPGAYHVTFQHGTASASIDVKVRKRKAVILEGDL